MINFNYLESKEELAFLLNIPIRKLTYILYIKRPDSFYTTFEIPKHNGKSRIIHAPQSDLKKLQSNLATQLSLYVENYTKESSIIPNISHAFSKGKSIITNASIHRNKRFIVNIDLKDFFDQFHFGRVRGFFHKNKYFNMSIDVATIIAQISCYKGKLPQGAPTSPIITNLICNILDMHIVNIAHKYNLNYTRYADDLTFSTNDKNFPKKYNVFFNELQTEINNFGFEINPDKTRFVFNTSHQEVTGLVVNKRINVCKQFYKETRAMADALYKNGEFTINEHIGTINQLEGRFSFINQIEKYNNIKSMKYNNAKAHTPQSLNSREKEYQKFLYYKYFYANSKPLIVTEGKTDIIYIKAALKKYYKEYPLLIQKKDNHFDFNISFLNKTKRMTYFLGIFPDGANTMKNIYNLYTGKSGYPNLEEYFTKKSQQTPSNPVFLLFDNEQIKGYPLDDFLTYIGKKNSFLYHKAFNIHSNLYLITNPLVNGLDKCEIEDLFDKETLSHIINGKTFCRDSKFDENKFYGKAIFANYISSNYLTISFEKFKPILDNISETMDLYYKSGHDK